MKADSSTKFYASKNDYLNRRSGDVARGLAEGPSKLADKAVDPSSHQSNKAPQEKNIVNEVKKAPEKIKNKLKKGTSAGSHLISQAASSAVKGLGSHFVPSIGGGVSAEITSETQAIKKLEDLPKIAIEKPGIFFIRGFSLNPFESEDAGLGAMASNIPTAEAYSWSDEDELIEAINSRAHSQPIILVGHGMGSDTAVSVANKLNNVEHGFRRIDLLVTLDSIGSDNDIVPQNVRENLNYISDQDYLLNDGPNIARNKSMTKIDNELVELSHDEMKDNGEIQFLIYEKINSTLMNAIDRRDLLKSLEGQREKALSIHRLASSKPNLYE